mmetsp:Transcript_31936/g.66967  ORF Transcript_31936/g.66967 Transcript_31936/m.66967 type:complete len:229 (+) Transcript_31936:1249-1935(+)
MRVHVNGRIGMLLPERAHQNLARRGGKKSCHVLYREGVNSHVVHELVRKIDVVFEIVLALRGVSDITRVGHGALYEPTRRSGSVHTKLEVIEVVERIKHTEDINSACVCLLAKLVNNIIGVVRVTHSIRSAKEHLEWHVGDLLPQTFQSFPRALMQESHGNIECCTTPHFQRESIFECLIGVFGAAFKFLGAHARGEEGLMRITPGGVHQEKTFMFPDSLGVAFWSLF